MERKSGWETKQKVLHSPFSLLKRLSSPRPQTSECTTGEKMENAEENIWWEKNLIRSLKSWKKIKGGRGEHCHLWLLFTIYMVAKPLVFVPTALQEKLDLIWPKFIVILFGNFSTFMASLLSVWFLPGMFWKRNSEIIRAMFPNVSYFYT